MYSYVYAWPIHSCLNCMYSNCHACRMNNITQLFVLSNQIISLYKETLLLVLSFSFTADKILGYVKDNNN